MSNLHPIFQGLFTRAVRTVDMPPEPYDHLHGRHCSCVEETRRPVFSLHAEDSPSLPVDPFMRRVHVADAVQRGRGLGIGRRSLRYMPGATR